MTRNSSNRELNNGAEAVSTVVVRQAVDLWLVVGLFPSSVAEAAIYFTCLAMDNVKTTKEIDNVM